MSKSSMIHRRGLPHLRLVLNEARPAAVAFLGGSITEGYGASEPDVTSWRALTGQYLQERYPQSPIRCVNAGVGGTTSSFGAFRLARHVFAAGEVDLLFVEFAVNDGADREESIRGMEGIVRECRRISPDTDICFVYTAADKNLSADMPFNLAVHEEVACHYGIPSLNLATLVYAKLQTGAVRWEELAPDRVHPNDAGYALYAEAVREYLHVALETVAEPEVGILYAWPERPLLADSYDDGEMADLPELLAGTGFTWVSQPPQPLINWRYDGGHWSSEDPQASFSFERVGQGAGLVLLCGPDTGIFEYSLDGGESFHQVDLFDEWCHGAYWPVISLFARKANQGTNQVIVRNTMNKNEASRGTVLRVLQLLHYGR